MQIIHNAPHDFKQEGQNKTHISQSQGSISMLKTIDLQWLWQDTLGERYSSTNSCGTTGLAHIEEWSWNHTSIYIHKIKAK